MKTLHSTLVLALLVNGLGGTDARATASRNSLGKNVRNRIRKTSKAATPRFAQEKFFGDLANGIATAGIMSLSSGQMGLSPFGTPMPNPGISPFGTPIPSQGMAQPETGILPVDISGTKQLQAELEDKLQKTSNIGDQLEEAVDTLEKTTGANERKGIDFSIHVMNPEATGEKLQQGQLEETTETKSIPPPLYTAPVIVLLPPEPTPIEKLEFARAIACRGKMSTPEMKAQRAAELADLSTIKGRTVADLRAELKETEGKLEKSKSDRNKMHEELRQIESNNAAGASADADIFFLKEDLKLQDQKIATILDKLRRLETRIHRLKQKQTSQEEED